jgi:hypothetical protein
MLDSGEEGVKNRCGWGPNLGEELEWKNDMSATVWFSPFLGSRTFRQWTFRQYGGKLAINGM